jgi:hypothetical protein
MPISRIDGFPSLSEVLPPQCRNGLDDDGDGRRVATLRSWSR